MKCLILCLLFVCIWFVDIFLELFYEVIRDCWRLVYKIVIECIGCEGWNIFSCEGFGWIRCWFLNFIIIGG